MITMKYFLLAVLCMSMQHSFCMEQPKKKEIVTTKLIKIKKWEDIQPFAGHVVAYKIEPLSFIKQFFYGNSVNLDTMCGYQLDPSKPIKYGHIDESQTTWLLKPHAKSGEIGYIMRKLLEKNQVESHCILVNSVVKSCNLSMSHVTTKEIHQILAAIDSDKAVFNTLFAPNNTQLILQKRLNYLHDLKKEYAEHMVQFLRAEPRTQTIHGKEIEKKNYEYQNAFKKLPIEIVRLIVNFRYTIEN